MSGLRVSRLSKRYGPTVALEEVTLDLRPGEVHALLGENGAGKSTLVGILSGFVLPDRGEVSIDETRLEPGDPLLARRAGVELVHQHFKLVPALTVGENFELARMGTLRGLTTGEIAGRVAEIGRGLGWSVDLSVRVETLSVGQRQRVEILKALAGEARVLLLDEPTATLAPGEIEELFRVLRRLAGEGRVVVLIAHKLSEVMAVADRATVLRGGVVAGTAAISETTENQLAEWMIGRRGEPPPSARVEYGKPTLQLNGLSAEGLGDVSFAVRAGEIYGIGGVDGNGQLALAETLAGLLPYTGSVIYRGEERDLHGLSCGYVPEDRQSDGLAMGMTIGENLHVRDREAWVRPRRVAERAQAAIDAFGIRAGGPWSRARELSGGNQQKVVLARALTGAADLVVAANPTRGLDLGARETIHDALRGVAAAGTPTVLITNDLDELFALAGTTAFLSRGRLREGNDPALMAGWED